MRACRTARRGIFRFKLRYCDAKFYEVVCLKPLRRKVLQSELCAQDLCKLSCGAEFALRCGFNPIAYKFCSAARNLSRCETIKFTERLASRRGLLCMQVLRCVCFAGKVLRRAIKFKYGHNRIVSERLNFKCTYG